MWTLKSLYYYLRFNLYWHFASSFIKWTTVIKMFIKRETRIYYLYGTGEVIYVKWSNYADVVRMDNEEYALIKRLSATGGIAYMKGERF